MKQTLSLCLLLALLVPNFGEEDIIAHLNNGDVEGEIMNDENGNAFYAFRGIPYAEAPTGDLRFKPPVPKRPWDTVLNAKTNGPVCPQVHMFNPSEYQGIEDNCLTINVYTPQLPKDKQLNLDVIINIHGGGFVFGNGGSDEFGPTRFMQKDKDIVLVSFTYRVSIFGFLNTNDTTATGNYGLLDQLEGLRWVQNNIDRFNGDPRKVTLFGESAGGASVLYHMLSPLSKGLFNKIVAMSGTPLDPWAFQPTPLHWAQQVARQVGCPEDKTKIAECLRKVDAKKLIENTIHKLMGLSMLHFGPSVDHHFLPDTPYNIIKRKQYNNVPLLMGFTRDEGDLFVHSKTLPPQDSFTRDEVFQSTIPWLPPVPNIDKAAEKVVNKYYPRKDSYTRDEVIATMRKIVTDGSFHNYMFQTAKMMSDKGTQVYFYSYDYEGEAHVLNKVLQDDIKFGVAHATDLFMFFNGMFFGQAKLESETSQQVKEKFQKIVTNFAKTGNPNSDNEEPIWPPLKGTKKIDVYHINDKCTLSTHDLGNDDMYKFWVKEITKATKEVLVKKKAKEEL